MSPSHRIKATGGKKKAAEIDGAGGSAPAWPSYKGTSQLVGTSPSGRVTVYVDPSLGQIGLAKCPRSAERCRSCSSRQRHDFRDHRRTSQRDRVCAGKCH